MGDIVRYQGTVNRVGPRHSLDYIEFIEIDGQFLPMIEGNRDALAFVREGMDITLICHHWKNSFLFRNLYSSFVNKDETAIESLSREIKGRDRFEYPEGNSIIFARDNSTGQTIKSAEKAPLRKFHWLIFVIAVITSVNMLKDHLPKVAAVIFLFGVYYVISSRNKNKAAKKLMKEMEK